jgi:hypothetical protein
MATPQRFTDQQMFDICEKLYQLNGFVKWADVGKALGVSRQAVQLRLRAAVARGELSESEMERWASISSRRATARENRARSRAHSAELERNDVKIRLSPENAEWLRQERVFRKATSADIINGLLTIARMSK